MTWVLVQERAADWPTHMVYSFGGFYSGSMARVLGASYGSAVFIMSPGGRFEAFFDADGVARLEASVLKKVAGEPEFAGQIVSAFQEKIGGFLEYCESLSQGGLEEKSAKELSAMIDEFWARYEAAYLYSEPFAFAVKDALANAAEARVRSALAGAGREKEFGKAFALLVSPVEKPFATQEEESLLKILVSIQERGAEKDLLNGNIGPDSRRLFAAHADEFFWVPFDYAGEVWTQAHFEDSARTLVLSHFDAKKRLAEIERYYSGLDERQAALEYEFALDGPTAAMLSTLRITGFIMDYKKECFTKAHYHYRTLLAAAAKRLGWTLQQAYAATPVETSAALLGTDFHPDPNAVRVLYAKDGVCQMLDGEEAKAFLAREGLAGKAHQPVTELKGTCACAGTVRGPAKIIRTAQELGKLKPGDILVTIMTTPDFVRGMKRAAAIVSDDGGITCHAAIVSREFGIPCVVGTHSASKVFFDGDILEVNASHGVVKKIG
ncbi:MAG: PEP-utilizing enzyme [Candidatus Micrarchaeota archaeon]